MKVGRGVGWVAALGGEQLGLQGGECACVGVGVVHTCVECICEHACGTHECVGVPQPPPPAECRGRCGEGTVLILPCAPSWNVWEHAWCQEGGPGWLCFTRIEFGLAGGAYVGVRG